VEAPRGAPRELSELEGFHGKTMGKTWENNGFMMVNDG
jgi:hypothetical protein